MEKKKKPESKTQKSRRLVAIMFTDIVGYTALMQEDEQKGIRVRARHREVFEQQHASYQGEIIQYYGDGTLSVFKSAVNAVGCALKIQKLLRDGEIKVPLRIALHVGDIVHDETEIYGDAVNVTARIESMSVAGSILLSGRINNELRNHKHILTQSLGTFEFKNVFDPVEVFSVNNPGLNVPSPKDLPVKFRQSVKSIAVLPFINMSADKENEFFCDGMTEELINALTKIKGLKVTSRNSSFFFKNKDFTTTEIGAKLNVSTLLEGSIRLSGDQMRITAQLIDVQDDSHFWSDTFDRSVQDVFAVQDEISLLIAERLREHIGHIEIADQLVKAPDISADLYKRYLRSRYHILKMTKPDIEKGLAILQEIIKEAPDFAWAYLGMHLGYTLMATIGFMPSREAFTTGQSFLQEAIRLDGNLPECQLHLSWISFLQDWNLEAAYQHLNKVLEARPLVDYYQSMASILVAEGKFHAAENYIGTALQIDPFSEINYHLQGYIFYTQKNYPEAIDNFRQSVELKPGSRVSLLYWGQALILQGQLSNALEHFQNIPDGIDDLLKIGGITMASAALGDEKQVQVGIRKLESGLNSDAMEQALNLLILCRTLMQDYEKAIELIEQGVQYHVPMMVYVFVDPIVQPLRSNPLFSRLMTEVLGKNTTSIRKIRKYKRPLLNPDMLKKHRRQLLQLMDAEKPHLDPNLTLSSLSNMMSIPANQLSQLLNEGFDQNFAEFVNSYRLKSFKALVADPEMRKLTILALAYQSGFNSKSVFNSYFKRATGQTPKAYWKTLHQ